MPILLVFRSDMGQTENTQTRHNDHTEGSYAVSVQA